MLLHSLEVNKIIIYKYVDKEIQEWFNNPYYQVQKCWWRISQPRRYY